MPDSNLSLPYTPTAGATTVLAGLSTSMPGIQGILVSVTVTANGTSQAATIYDNIGGTASGTVLGVVPSGATAGQTYPFNARFTLGITISGSANNPALTLEVSE